jgi:hypothetical protein
MAMTSREKTFWWINYWRRPEMKALGNRLIRRLASPPDKRGPISRADLDGLKGAIVIAKMAGADTDGWETNLHAWTKELFVRNAIHRTAAEKDDQS